MARSGYGPDDISLLLPSGICISLFQKFLNKSCFTGSKETGNNVNLYHFVFPLSMIQGAKADSSPKILQFLSCFVIPWGTSSSGAGIFAQKAMTRKHRYPLVIHSCLYSNDHPVSQDQRNTFAIPARKGDMTTSHPLIYLS